MTLTAAVIGCGGISRFHFAGLEKFGAKVKWVCDLSQAAASPWVDKTGATFTADYKDIIADPDVDVITICTLSASHKEICLAAIDAGKAVICEKTLSVNADDALEIAAYGEQKQTIFYTSYMKRFIAAVQKAKELLPSLGQIVSTYIRTYQNWGDLWTEMPAEGLAHTPTGGESAIRRNYGGAILPCGGSHILDLVCFLLGRPNKLYATMHTPAGRDYDLQTSAMLETANGIVHYEALIHNLSHIGIHRDGWDERIEINGLNGRLDIYTAKWDEVEHKASLLVHYDNSTGDTTEHHFEAVSPFDDAVAFFCDSIVAGKQGDQSRITGYDVDELIDHIKLSAAEGRAVDVEYRIG